MNTRVTWTLWAAAILLGAVALWDWNGRKPGAVAAPKRLFPGMDIRTVDRVEIIPGGELPPITLSRIQGRWMLGTNRYPAQQTPIETLVTNLLGIEVKETIPLGDTSPESLAEFGLKTPRLLLRVGPSNSLESLAIGGRTPLTNQIYLRLGDSQSILIADVASFGAVPFDASSLRDPRLLPVDDLQLKSIHLRAQGGAVRLERLAGGPGWEIVHPLRHAVDSAKMAAFTQLLSSTQVGFLTPKAQAEMAGAFTNEVVELALEFEAGPTVQLRLAPSPTGPDGTAVAERDLYGDRVLLADSLLQALATPFRAFNDPVLVSVPAESMSRIEVVAAERFAIERGTNGLWTAPGPKPTPLDSVLVSQFLENLRGVAVVDYLGSNLGTNQLLGLRLLPPIAHYAVFATKTNQGGMVEPARWGTLEFGVNQLELIPIRLQGASNVFWGQFSDLLRLPKRLFELRDRSLWKLGPPDIHAVISAAGTRVKVYERAPDGSWLRDPIANAAAAETVFRFGAVKAVSWVASGEQRMRAFGIQAESVAIGLQARVDGETRLYSVSFGNRSPSGNVYASTQLPDSAERLIFEFPGQLHAELIRAFPPSP